MKMLRHSFLLVSFLMLTCVELLAQKDEVNFKVSDADQHEVDENLEDSIFYTLTDAINDPMRVRQLIVESKGLKVLPNAILSFKNLRVLDISHNRISSLPDSLFLACLQLEELRYAGNELLEIPKAVYHSTLKVLDVSENHITVISDQIGTCKHLEELDVHANDVSMLPTKYVVLHHLKSIILSENPLKKTGSWMFHQPQLKILFLDNTQIESLDASIYRATHLKLLNIESNTLQYFPSGICQLKGLKVLMLEGNPLTTGVLDELMKCLPDVLIR